MRYQRPSDIATFKASGPERLERLARFLDDLPSGMLTFTRWYGHGRGCAVGLAAHRCVWMQAQGLQLENSDGSRVSHPAFGGQTDWPAVASFFELSPEGAMDLFSARGYGGDLRPDPRTVAARIRSRLAAMAAVTA
ncbi:MAG: hypothetical protein JJ899_15960 [Alphaproteobacteria bacterium]|nr:hypothetical protein [Alphaproteobacteria bacterium]